MSYPNVNAERTGPVGCEFYYTFGCTLLYLTTQIAYSRGDNTAAPLEAQEITGPGERAALPLVPLSTLPPRLCLRVG